MPKPNQSKVIPFSKTSFDSPAQFSKRRQAPPDEHKELVWSERIIGGERYVSAMGAAGHNANSTASGIYWEAKGLRDEINSFLSYKSDMLEREKPITVEDFRTEWPYIHQRMSDSMLRRLAQPFDELDTYKAGERTRQDRGMVTEIIVDSLTKSIHLLKRSTIQNCVEGGKLKK